MQDAIVFCIVAAALGYLVRGFWLSHSGKKGCGSCGSGGGCGTKKVPAASGGGLIQIGLNGSVHSGPQSSPRRHDGHAP